MFLVIVRYDLDEDIKNFLKIFLKVKNLRLLNSDKIFCLSYLFLISIFTPNLYANPIENYFYSYLPPNFEDFLSISIILGFSVSTITYLFKKSKRKEFKPSSNFINILLFDFWFDKFVLIKLITFIYFLSLTAFYTSLIFGFLLYIYNDFPFFLISNILISPIILIILRILLELFIATIKKAENSSRNIDKFKLVESKIDTAVE